MQRSEHAFGGRGPVVVLAYAYSSVARLEQVLAGSAALACTSGTGLLPLCAEAADTWRRVDGRTGPLSPLAAASVRTLFTSMITVILARSGGSRWCETSFAPPAVTETFLQLCPGARLLCWHRDAEDVIRAGVQANPWGLAGRGLTPFVAAYPGNSAAAVAAYWAERTEALLRFEAAHPDSCRRVRYEDLTRHPDQAATGIAAFLGLDAAAWPAGQAGARLPGAPDDCAAEDQSGNRQKTGPADLKLPASHLPQTLVERVDGLQARLGYAPLTISPPE